MPLVAPAVDAGPLVALAAVEAPFALPLAVAAADEWLLVADVVVLLAVVVEAAVVAAAALPVPAVDVIVQLLVPKHMVRYFREELQERERQYKHTLARSFS